MSPTFDALAEQALALPLQQRVELVQRLRSSVEDQLAEDDELFAEIARRDAEVESGAVPTYSHEEVINAVRKAIGE